ncbi:MAG: S-layer homology domain-containing protein [Eubacteriales bacterium]|nr:S-layer homology domain-containing protein [Eubacteriales bacterium]
MDAEGDYVFTPVIEDHTVSADLPEITVTVGAQPLMMALRTGTPDTYGDFSVSIDESGEAPTFDESSETLTFSVAGEYTVGMADGKTSTTNRIEVTSAANITLDGVNIDVSGTENAAAFKITDTAGAVNITLADGSVNTLKSGKYCAGLQKDTTAEGTMLTIGGTGTLNATSGGFAAGIGGSNAKNGSYITISGGRITATGNGAGIGGGISASGNHIVISGGTVTTRGGYMAAGIGGGHGGDGRYITISGGTVTAEGGDLSVGIGAGTDGVSSNITISGGSVNAYCYSGNAIGATPTNGADTPVNVYKVVIPITGDTTGGVDISSMTFTSGGNAYIYNMFGAKSILDSGVGKVYVYLPGSSEGIAATASYGGVTYSGGVTSSATTLTPPAPQAQWGVAGSGGAKPTAWTQGTLADAMSYANSLASGTAYIQLLSDVNLNAALDFVSGKTTILDLNGKKIDRGLTAAISDGNVVNINGNLTLKDSSTAIVANQGKITGGFSSGPASTYVYNGGCVDVNNHASFTMTGGNITGNKSTNSSPGGGGVYVDQYGSFIMTGGSIDNNEALYWGGGIYANGSFTMLGGSITGNKSKNGGVYFASNFTVGGATVIDDNQTTDEIPVERNVMLVNDTISVHSGTPLTTGAFIGVTANSAPTSGLPVNVTGTNSNDYSSYFFSDNSGYMIQNSASNVVQLAVLAPVIGPLTISDSFTAGHNLALSDLDGYKPSITNNGVTITAQGWQQCVEFGTSSSGWSNWSAGVLSPDTGSTYKLRYYATYSDGTVYSNEVTLNVVGNTTSLALTATPESPQNTGTPITLTATLTGFFPGTSVSGQAIIFKNGGSSCGNAALNAAGVAVFSWTPPGTGTYSLTAEYYGSLYNTAAASSAVSYTVVVDSDTEAVTAAKTALIDGSVNVAFGASQADKTAAVQAYVNGLLTGDVTGVTAIVTYNSSTGKYDVAISKGSVNDTKSLSMTVNIAPDPDIAIVAVAKTAAQGASYSNMTQAAATDENAIETALKNTAVTAVNSSDITITIDKYSYIPPIAGTSANPGGTNGSYTFTVMVSKGTQSETTEQKTITITATPYTGGTGGGGSNGGGSTTPPSTKPTEPVTGSTENKAAVDDKGNASVSLTDKNITDAIADAKAEAAKKGVNAGDITAVIHVTTSGKNADTVTVNLPKTTQEQVIGNKIASVQLVIDRPDLTIGIDLAAVTEINRQAKADVQLSATRMDNTKLSGNAKAAIGNRPAYDLNALYGSGKSVTDFGKGSVSVEIPYTLQKGEIAGNVYAVYVDGNGKVTYLTDSSYDAKRGTVMFSTNHFSTYGVAYKASFKFTDINGHWAKDDILFVANRGLMTGTGATTFSPNGSMTRGMFVTALGRLADADISIYKQSSFTDVKADAYYRGYIEWGVKNNILVGIGGGKFDPDGLVTREQMAVIMDRYATAIGFKLPEVHAQNTFADNTKIGAWAAPSVKRIQMAGIIQGKGNNLYDPQGTATRAEVSAVMRRFVELAIFSDTAQGWSMNDSGQWMYYENGKPIIGKKDIGGTTYTFDQYGVTTDVPKGRTYATYTVQRGDSFWAIARKFNCTMAELERLNNKSRFSLIHPGDVLRVPEK